MWHYLILILLLTPLAGWAETIYLSQSGSGTGSGADTSNRMSAASFNTAGNWDVDVSDDGKIGPGDTVSVGGSISTALVFQGSGTSGNVITLLFESDGKMSAAYWTADGAIQLGTQSYITIDGGNTGTVGARATVDGSTWNVTVECTANGTLLANQQGTRGIVGVGGSNITIKNARFKDLYVRDPGSADTNEYGGAVSISVTANGSIENCYIREGVDGAIVKANGAGVTGLNVSDCDIARVSNGIKPGCQDTSSWIDGATIVRNRLDEFDVWQDDANGGDHHHSDGIQLILGGAGMRSYRTVIAYNHIGPSMGTMGHTTSAIFCEDDSQETYIYNNYVEIGVGHWMANPAIQGWQGAGYTGGQGVGLIANNTIVGAGTGSAIAFLHHHAVGNVVDNLANFLTAVVDANTGDPDYNVFWGPSGDTNGQCYVPSGTGAAIYSSFAQWQTHANIPNDWSQNSLNSDPDLDANGLLNAGSPAIGLAPTQTIFTDDFYGNARSVPWDAGAFEYEAASPTVRRSPSRAARTGALPFLP